ncbi:hypothetical protein [Fervidibacter sacchari]
MGRTKTIHATGFSQWLIDEIFKRRICSAFWEFLTGGSCSRRPKFWLTMHEHCQKNYSPLAIHHSLPFSKISCPASIVPFPFRPLSRSKSVLIEPFHQLRAEARNTERQLWAFQTLSLLW